MKNCYSCNTVKPLSDFVIDRSRKDGRLNKCRTCDAVYKRERLEDSRSWYREYRSTLACVECGQDHPATLDFHHLDPTQKEGGVAQMVRSRTSMTKVKAEIAKCIVLCSNCHRIHHWNERQDNPQENYVN